MAHGGSRLPISGLGKRYFLFIVVFRLGGTCLDCVVVMID